jgi:hypothetical protein
MYRKILGEKLLRLRCRIEDWTSLNDWSAQDNKSERKNKDGEVVWKRSDWEYVDSMYSIILNGDECSHWDRNMFKEFNRMWKRYKIEGRHEIQNPNFEPEWKQLQHMEWADD